MSFRPQTLLAATPGQKVRLHFWGSEAVVFNPESAETHLLTLPAGRLLQAVQERMFSYPELRDAFAAENADQFTGQDAAVYLDEALARLISLKLVQSLENSNA